MTARCDREGFRMAPPRSAELRAYAMKGTPYAPPLEYMAGWSMVRRRVWVGTEAALPRMRAKNQLRRTRQTRPRTRSRDVVGATLNWNRRRGARALRSRRRLVRCRAGGQGSSDSISKVGQEMGGGAKPSGACRRSYAWSETIAAVTTAGCPIFAGSQALDARHRKKLSARWRRSQLTTKSAPPRDGHRAAAWA